MIINERNRAIEESIPLTMPTGKFRVKSRSMYYEYGQPFSSRSSLFTWKNYVEWQISYDSISKPDHHTSIAYEGRERKKFLVELSFYFYQFFQWGIVSRRTVTDLINYLEDIDRENLIDHHEHCKISRTHPDTIEINGIPFASMTLRYPQLVYHFRQYEIIAEITVREKQRAVGVQPMLYFCIPISELDAHPPLIGRTAKLKEAARFTFSESNYEVILQMMKIFGILSDRHREDILRIVRTLL